MEEKKYKVADIASILGITPKTIYKLIENEELKTIQDTIRGRKITLVLCTDSELETLKNKYLEIKGKNTVNESNYEDILTGYEVVNESKNIQTPDLIDKFMNFSITVNEQHNNQLKEYIERVIESEKQVRLLEDSERNKENGYLRQIAELKAELEKERLKSKKWWQLK